MNPIPPRNVQNRDGDQAGPFIASLYFSRSNPDCNHRHGDNDDNEVGSKPAHSCEANWNQNQPAPKTATSCLLTISVSR